MQGTLAELLYFCNQSTVLPGDNAHRTHNCSYNASSAAVFIIRSSLERKESRGPFFRRDFPADGQRQVARRDLLKKSSDGMRFEQRPYALPLFKPDFETRDNLEVAW